ncbi:hypothetical protein C3L50_10270 [Flavobacterium alvei]|uniref:Rhamnosyl transferase n=1 Tax=Flavobacterium alvei TaxID=2080416 RepID=A0A2S5AAF9_9FLAO|nr:glycosyltransferase [Flavobacterium alvei]POY39545.1 hypothetical protein C3L50_10270 [Flavobacterium alvei]
MFAHYLITRFNLRNSEWNLTKNNETLLNDEWMEDRMYLFENFCLPSVAAQTNKNFTWLLYFDTTTPEKFKKRIEFILSKYANFKALFIDGMPEFYPKIQEFIANSSVNFPHIITSRIDNDDCLHKNFINEIQNQFSSQNFQAIDVIKGYTLQIAPNYILGKKEHLFNPFISLIELNKNPKTVWFSNHAQWKKENRITQITHERLWLSIIHAKNKVNQFDGYGDVKWEDIKINFVVSENLDTLISKEQIPYSQWKFLSFLNKIKVDFNFLSKKFKKNIGIYKYK